METEREPAPTHIDAATERLIERLWAAPAPPRRGPRPMLSVERIVDAAFELANTEGLEAVTMARVGKALGVTPMALYRHVSNKDELLTLLADRIADVPPLPSDVGWREGLELWVRAQIDAALARPWILDLPLSALLPGPVRLRWIDQAFGMMRDVPLTAGEKFGIIGLLAQHVLGEARVQIEHRRAAATAVKRMEGLPESTPDTELDPELMAAANPYSDIELLLRHHADPATYPHLLRAVSQWDDSFPDPGDDIGYGVGILLDGIEAYIARRAREQEAPRGAVG